MFDYIPTIPPCLLVDVESLSITLKSHDMVGGRNPAPPRMVETLSIMG